MEEEDDEEDEEVDEEDENELEFVPDGEDEEDDEYWDSQCFIGLQALHHQITTYGWASVYLFPQFCTLYHLGRLIYLDGVRGSVSVIICSAKSMLSFAWFRGMSSRFQIHVSNFVRNVSLKCSKTVLLGANRLLDIFCILRISIKMYGWAI